MSCMSLPPIRLPSGFASLGKMTSAICDCEARTVRGSSVRGRLVSMGVFGGEGLPSFILASSLSILPRRLFRGGPGGDRMPRQVGVKITLRLGLHTFIRMRRLPFRGRRVVAQFAIGYGRVSALEEVLDGDQGVPAVHSDVAAHEAHRICIAPSGQPRTRLRVADIAKLAQLCF